MPQIGAREAAAMLDLTLEDLITSRRRGLPPGILGYKVAGRLVFDTEALAPTKAGKPAEKLTARELRNRIAEMGFTVPAWAKKAELEAAYQAAVAVGAQLPEAIEELGAAGEGAEAVVIEAELEAEGES
jgi:hypothetical protein